MGDEYAKSAPVSPPANRDFACTIADMAKKYFADVATSSTTDPDERLRPDDERSPDEPSSVDEPSSDEPSSDDEPGSDEPSDDEPGSDDEPLSVEPGSDEPSDDERSPDEPRSDDAIMDTIRERATFAASHPQLDRFKIRIADTEALYLAINLGDIVSMEALMDRGARGDSKAFKLAAAASPEVFETYIACNGHLAYDKSSEFLGAEDIEFGSDRSRALYAKLISLM